MSNNFELKYSDDGLLSRVLFLTSSNSVTVFVEDADKEYEYEEIFEKLFPEELRIDCIFPTGGKIGLEEAFSLFGNSVAYGATFFIADGDFDLALGKDMINADNFIYLRRYNIESYLLNEDAVVQYMRPKLKKTKQETKRKINYQEWINALSPFLKKLFALHYVVQKYAPQIENVGRNPAMFLTSNGLPKECMYDAYKNEIGLVVPDVSEKIDLALEELNAVYGDSIGAFVCGKYYIYALKLLLNTMLKKKINENDVKAFFISWLRVDQLQYVKEKFLDYIVKQPF